MKFEKITHVRLPFDRRAPEPNKNYGIGGLDIWFILKGPRGAVQFAVNFPVNLPHIELEYPAKFPDWNERKHFMGIDVGYHAPKPQYEGQNDMECQHLEGGRCYYDGSSLRAQEWVDELFSTRGQCIEPLIWERLEQYYKERFGEDT